MRARRRHGRPPAGIEDQRAVDRGHAAGRVAKASSAPSSAAMRFSNIRTVGLP